MNIKISEKAVLYRINQKDLKQNQTSIGAYIRKERTNQGLKQDYVCKDICSVSYFSRIERNKVLPSTLYISKIFKKLNKPIPHELGNVDNHLKKEIIYNFLTAIEYRNDKLVEEEYQKITTMSDINQDLYDLVYHTYHKNMNLLENVIRKLHPLQDHFDNEELLIYLENLGNFHLFHHDYINAEKVLNLALRLLDKLNFIKPLILYKYAWILGKLHYDLKCIEYAEEADRYFYN